MITDLEPQRALVFVHQQLGQQLNFIVVAQRVFQRLGQGGQQGIIGTAPIHPGAQQYALSTCIEPGHATARPQDQSRCAARLGIRQHQQIALGNLGCRDTQFKPRHQGG
ncbi:hypothetical protein PSC71_00405 [Devosia sp. J2-20]|uniref:hypothetical protein n=1 Tax=Devosia sp. J2-20 TaxID=3026161 RepID=UPI00249CB31A|nr:hypothetical protein [Devosia sp. J2-20]WDQ99310.1 hypothetical protein PSC71_00405 [Devosia sp. J2-20]